MSRWPWSRVIYVLLCNENHFGDLPCKHKHTAHTEQTAVHIALLMHPMPVNSYTYLYMMQRVEKFSRLKIMQKRERPLLALLAGETHTCVSV